MKLSMIYGGIIMSTTIYLIRHSKPLKVNNNLNNDNLQIQNEKSSLSIEGEQIAKEKLNNKEFNKKAYTKFKKKNILKVDKLQKEAVNLEYKNDDRYLEVDKLIKEKENILNNNKDYQEYLSKQTKLIASQQKEYDDLKKDLDQKKQQLQLYRLQNQRLIQLKDIKQQFQDLKKQENDYQELNKTIDTLKKHKKQIIYIFLILNNKRNFKL